MPRTVLASESFVTGPLSGNFTQTNNAGSGDAVAGQFGALGNNNSNAPSTASGSTMFWSGAGAFTNDHYSKVTVTGLSAISNNYWVGASVRMSADTYTARDQYSLVVACGTSSPYPTLLYKLSGGVYTLIDSTNVAWVNGDTLELEIVGGLLICYRNGVEIAALSGNTDLDLTTGKPGCGVSTANVAAFPGLLNFEGGSGSLTGGDLTAPVLSAPTGTQTGATTATVGATTNEGNGTMYAVVTTSVTQPSVAQIKVGQNDAGAAAAWAGNQAISTVGLKTLNATGLTVSTAYYAHVVHTDASGNDSNRVTSAQFTTSAAPVPTITTDVLRNEVNAVLASVTINKVVATRLSDLVQVCTWADQVTSAGGVLTLVHASLTAVPHIITTSNTAGTAAGAKVYTPV